MHSWTLVGLLAMISIATACSRNPSSRQVASSAVATDTPVVDPPSGTNADETRSFAAKVSVPAPCVVIDFDTIVDGVRTQAIVVLPKPDPAPVEPHVRTAGADEETEKERLARIYASRGRKLLDLATPDVDASGCYPVVGNKLDSEAQYYVMDALKRSAAMVKDPVSGNPSPSINIHFYGSVCGPTCGMGRQSAALPGKPPFLSVLWWIS